jgi:hypothetical protein
MITDKKVERWKTRISETSKVITVLFISGERFEQFILILKNAFPQKKRCFLKNKCEKKIEYEFMKKRQSSMF